MRALVTACDHAARRLDANAVGRSSVGDPPAALIEPDLAMPAARIEPVDHDVAVLPLAHAIATALRDGSELDVADAARVLDLDRERLHVDGCLRVLGSRRALVARRRRRIELCPAPEERHAIRARDALGRATPQLGEQLPITLLFLTRAVV